MRQAGRALQNNARYGTHFRAFLVLAMLLVSMGLGTTLVPMLGAAAPAPASPAPRAEISFTVNALGEPTTGTDATCATTCTLRQAVNASNAHDPGIGNFNKIFFDPATFATAQTIRLSNATGFGTLALTQPVAISGPGTALLTIDGGCTDCGAGKANSGTTGVGVFAVNSAITVAFSNLTLAHGNAANNGGLNANSGGAIANNGGAITVTNCTFTNNLASSTLNGGGAIFSSGPLTITGSAFTGNVSGFLGGAIESVSNSMPIMLVVTGSTFTGNQAAGDGGAIDNNVDSTATITASTFTGNTAAHGGNAITNISLVSNFPAYLTLVNSTLSGNIGTSTTIGGAISSSGGAATTVIAGSTISGNTAAANNSTAGVLVLGGSTITLTDTISAGNTLTGTGGSPDLFSDTGALFTGRNNIIGVGTGTNFTFLIDGGDGNQVGNAARPRNPLLAPLASNGGPVQTRALLPGSLAIDTGTCAYTDATGVAQTLATDARGITRPQGAGCDVGSYELVIAPPTSFIVNRAADDMADANCTPARCTLRQIVNAANATNPSPGNINTITFDPTVFAAPQTITLSSAPGFGTLTLRRSLTITGPGAPLLTVDGGCTDCGAGKANTSNTGVTVFAVNPNVAVSFSGLTIANGDAARVDSVLNGGAISNGGNNSGASSNGGGAVTVTNGAFANNRSASGGAIYNNAGTVTVTGSAFTGNEADSNGVGGAIVSMSTNSSPGVLAVTSSTFTGNQAGGGSGAIANEQNSTATITASTFTGNTSPVEGAISNSSGRVSSTPARLTLINSTLSGNTSTGILARGLRTNGSGILVNGGDGSTLAIVGSTISGNTAAGNYGTGGVYASAPGGTITFTDTILAGNTVTDTTANFGTSPDLLYEFNGSTQPFVGTNNVIGVGDASTDFSGLANGTNGNQVGTTAMPLNPLLAPLSNYGGPVQTRALLPGSPAIDTGTCAYTDATGTASTLATDARGITRPQLITCDAGAFESRGFTTSARTGNRQSTPVNAAFASPVGLTVSSAFNEPVAGGQITYTIVASGGASATFSAAGGCALTSATVAVCPIDVTGIATGPAFTANGVAGAFTIVATATGIITPTTFTETNTAITPTPITTTTALTSSLNPSTVGQSVTFTASVSGAGGPPTGTVTFKEGATILGTGTLSSGTATFSTASLGVGTHPITAVYSGDATFAASTSNTVTQVVNAKGTTLVRITITGPNSTPPPTTIKVGQSVPITATGTYSSSPPQDLTTQVQWSSTNPTIAKVDPAGSATAGRVTGESPGTVTIAATLNGVTQTFTVTVVAPTPIGITVQPAPASRPGRASDPGAGLPAPAASPAGR